MSSLSSSTVLAWLQKELTLYFELQLLSPIEEKEDWQTQALICLGHRYFPTEMTDIVEKKNQLFDTSKLFEKQLLINKTTDWYEYIQEIQQSLIERQTEDTLRDLHIGNDQSVEKTIDQQYNQVFNTIYKLYEQCIDCRVSTTTRSMTEEILTELPKEEYGNMTLDEILLGLNHWTTNEYLLWKQSLDELPIQIKLHPRLSIRISAIDATHAALHLQLHKGDKLRTTIQFTNQSASIRNELEFIQAKMLKTTTTDVGIQDLEVRTKLSGQSIQDLNDKFKELFISDNNCLQEFEFLNDKYKLICSWVDDVRVWFVEAERIKSWIEERIQLLESKPNMNALEEVELDIELNLILQLNNEQKQLEKQVELFDKEDMTRLRAHVKALTGGNKDLSPADTTTIEITFTTLMTLDRLMHLLRRHAYELQILTLRMYWEQEYNLSVTWVRKTGENVRIFVQQKARWRPTTTNEEDLLEKNEIINTLIDFEKQSNLFDQGQFTTTVNCYQDLDDACNIELPSHLESRQVAIEESFEELTNRIGFARQVVEQYLVVNDFLEKADILKLEGDQLRQDIIIAAEQYGDNNLSFQLSDFIENVSLFQENAVRLVTSVASRVPYPESTHPTDEQGNEDANEMIRMVIGARKSALVLFGEALDHSLASFRKSIQLQKRAKQLNDEIIRLQSWIDERMRSIKKSKVDVFVGKCALDETDLSRLNKERDGQVAKMKGMKENDIKKLLDNIQLLRLSTEQPPHNENTLNLVNNLSNGMIGLEEQFIVLDDALLVHSLCLDILGKRISWETQHSKSTLWISNMTYSVWEFISRKAQWRSDIELNLNRLIIEQEFDLMKSKVQEFHIDQLKPVDQTFNELTKGFSTILNNADFDANQSQDNITLEHVQRRQNTLDTSYHNLCDLIEFSKQVLDQYILLDQFSIKIIELTEEGYKLMSDIQEANNSVMKISNIQEQKETFVTKVKLFGQSVIQVWMQHGSQLPYPQCPEDARSTRPSTNDDEISTEIATIVFKKYTDLQDLLKKLTDLLQKLDTSLVYKSKLENWCKESNVFDLNVKELTKEIDTCYSFDLSTGLVIESNSVPINDYKDKCELFSNQVNELNQEKYQGLLNGLNELKSAVENDEQMKSIIDPAITQGTMIALESSWKELNDRVDLFKNQSNACYYRTQWETIWNKQWDEINSIQDQVREWMNEKNLWISSTQGNLNLLISRIQLLNDQCFGLEEKIDPLKLAFKDMMNSYQSFDMVYTTSLETKQDELDKLFYKLQEMVNTQVNEIQVLKERYDWELQVDEKLKSSTEKSIQIETWIRNKARWSTQPSTQLDLPIIDTQVNELSDLLNQLVQLQTKNSTLLQSESIYKRKSLLESTIEKLQNHIDFMNQVISQRDMIMDRLIKISELETLAESLKSKFLKSDKVDGKETRELQDYITRVSQLESTMSYPVRHYRDHDAFCREQDIAHNAVMTDMLLARRSRLDELGTSLESILKSKERVSRCKAAEETYMSEANTVKEWIDSKNLQLNELESSLQDIQVLRISVNSIDALQSSVTTYTSSVLALKESANQCVIMIQQQQGDDDEILGRIQSTQLNINQIWNEFVDRVSNEKNRLSTLLRHKEFIHCVDSFKKECQDLTITVKEMELSTVTEDISNQWQNDIDMISNTFIEQIKSRLTEEKTKQDSALIKDMSDMYTIVLDEFEKLKNLVSEKTMDANHDRLKKEYFIGADKVDDCIKETRNTLNSNENRLIYGKSIEEDQNTVNEVTIAYQSLCDVFEKYHETYDEQRSFYRFLQLNKVSGLSKVDSRQQDLEQRWKQLKQDVVNDKQHTDSVSQWFDLHSKLNEMKSESLAGILKRLQDMKMDEIMPSFLDQDQSLLKLLESRLSTCWDTAMNLVDDGNLIHFETRFNDIQLELKNATDLLIETKLKVQQHVDFNHCQNQFISVKESILELNKEIKSRLDGTVIEENSSKYLEPLYRSISTNLSNTEIQQKKLKAQCLSVQETVNVFKSKYTNDDRIESIETDIDTTMNLLDKVVETEQFMNDMLRRALGHSKSAENIITWVENCQTAINQILNDNLDESESNLELSSLKQKLLEFEHVIDSFKELSTNLLLMEQNNQDGVTSQCIQAVKDNSEYIDCEWIKIQDEFKDVEATVLKTTRGTAIARKIKNIMAMVGETREYLNAYKLFDADDNCSIDTTDISIHSEQASDTQVSSDDEKTAIEGEEKKLTPQPLSTMLRQFEVENIQQNLQTMESDMKPQIESELEQLKQMMSDIEDIDPMFICQYEQVKESTTSLFQLFKDKYIDLEKAMDIGKYLTMADDIEILQSSLQEAVSKSAPHHATLIGSSFSRTDLHAKLIELDARFNYYEKKIVQTMTQAKEQATIIIDKQQPESNFVSNHLKEMEEKWLLIKKQFKTRKIELSRTIDTSVDPHDHHARIRKSSLPTRKASSILRERADSSTLARQRLSPTASSSSNSSKGSVNRLHPNRSTNRYLTPPLQHQPSKSATHVKPKPNRVNVSKTPLNSYVADPHNDLDIEIGRIVNETPYRVKVKMVPGEVGRYWFGNLNPKLAYCRVLKSKMVMVRVGGGWTELSQFLRDHALLEGDFIPRSQRNHRTKMIPEEEEPKSPTIQEGFIETRRDFGKQRSISPQNRSSTTTNSSRSSNSNHPTGSPSHSASTNTAGYKDGDKFIAVDHHGNQLEVKMRKVMDIGRNMSTSTANTNDYTRRRIARRKEKSDTNPSITTTKPVPSKVNSPVTTTKNTSIKNTNVKNNT